MTFDYSRYETLLCTQNGRILTISMNKPEQLNAASQLMHYELSRIFIDVADDPEVDVAILTGEGRAFSAGGDIEHMRRSTEQPSYYYTSVVEGKRTLMSMLDCPKPIICRMNGDAIGLGATLALFCDIVVAVDTAKIADPHTRVGYVAGDGGAAIWPQLIGYMRAKQYLLAGGVIMAPEAAQIGLITFSVPADELDAKVAEWADRFANGARRSIQWTKMTINTGLKQIAASMLDVGFAYEGMSNHTEDHREAVDAFLNKRKPKFSGN
ncbi:enoyl-CoA hydratase [Sphingomonas jinjuensis]|uniref:Enoyl-CoA hydratase n=1 Tax=Sphingomonas jinjuensis TaxID=535907 RepID=A0A840FEI3_9SPHN|nr:enoyl-CoA hydratase-related protein [Sphingomonas jinjuensis]MBB4155082.1 enoyl-CoA hydratase [Sphingomonas jinjuensis]